jgi:histidinol phosphatase-like enzyme
MTKLLVLDKDGTITQTKSGETFPTHPEDQELIEGVSEAVQRYVDDGWTIAIASNQGGCQVRDCKAIDFPVGAYYVNGNDKPLMVVRKSQSRERIPHSNEVDSFVMLTTVDPRPNGKDYLYFSAESIIQFQYKTIDMAIAEMQYAMQLTGINTAYFCPDSGESLRIVEKDCDNIGWGKLFAPFRKPSAGMLQVAESRLSSYCDLHEAPITKRLMIGDRPEDQSAAQNAGFDFMWAEDWRN